MKIEASYDRYLIFEDDEPGAEYNDELWDEVDRAYEMEQDRLLLGGY